MKNDRIALFRFTHNHHDEALNAGLQQVVRTLSEDDAGAKNQMTKRSPSIKTKTLDGAFLDSSSDAPQTLVFQAYSQPFGTVRPVVKLPKNQ